MQHRRLFGRRLRRYRAALRSLQNRLATFASSLRVISIRRDSPNRTVGATHRPTHFWRGSLRGRGSWRVFLVQTAFRLSNDADDRRQEGAYMPSETGLPGRMNPWALFAIAFDAIRRPRIRRFGNLKRR
jgi:hypothetical protein